MSHWVNGASQVITNVGVTNIDFRTPIVPGSNPLTQGGNHTFAYQIKLVKPSGESGPTPMTAALTVNGIVQEHTRSFGEIDTGVKSTLSAMGELQQLQVGDAIAVRVKLDPNGNSALPIQISTSPNRCTLTLRRVTGQGT